MIYRKLYVYLLIRIGFILLNCFLISYSYIHLNDVLIQMNLFVFLGLQIYFMIRGLNRINVDLENFFNSVRNNDSSMIYSYRRKNSPYLKLYEQFDLLNHQIQRIKIENENQNQYFKVLVEHVGVGLLTFNEKGKVSLFNQAAKQLVNKPTLYRVQELDCIQSGLSQLLQEMKPSEQKLVSLYRNNELIQLSVKATEIKIMEEKLKLISLQNIRNELDEKELDSWQKLIRVLTHEIMNSVGPINSTISTLSEFLTQEETGEAKSLAEIDEETIEDTVTGLHIIEERSRGMLDFVTRFRNLTVLPQPEYTCFSIVELFKSIQVLMEEQLREEKVDFRVIMEKKDHILKADKGLLEQVLLNLVRNGMQAMEGKDEKTLVLEAVQYNGHQTLIQVKDNGKGIESDIRDKIFIPFFTTREKGSGIGLSLSRQIMRLHGGTLTMRSQPGKGTVFQMKF
ncbi:MAG: PAS domain-containing sensor histidine kinase [Marinifilaceae bacterium]